MGLPLGLPGQEETTWPCYEPRRGPLKFSFGPNRNFLQFLLLKRKMLIFCSRFRIGQLFFYFFLFPVLIHLAKSKRRFQVNRVNRVEVTKHPLSMKFVSFMLLFWRCCVWCFQLRLTGWPKTELPFASFCWMYSNFNTPPETDITHWKQAAEEKKGRVHLPSIDFNFQECLLAGFVSGM